MTQNYDLRTLRLKRGIGLEEISNSIKRLSLSRLCKIEDNPKSAVHFANEMFEIIQFLDLNNEETNGFIHWLFIQCNK